ncbi:DMT family transporter [Paenarthrobacter sp. NPDC056912]|uniref:DMT family transporter n=1 Tax=Paenarthrobacter sp. NPDC056912 TaxID=3345965 RepID=UPI00366F0308
MAENQPGHWSCGGLRRGPVAVPSPPHQERTGRWGAPAVIITAILWGTTGVASALIPQENPVAVGAASVGVGGLILGLISFSSVVKSFKTPGATKYLLLGSLGLMFYMPLFYVSVSLTGAALGTIIAIGSGPLFAGIFEWLVDGRPVTRRWAASMLTTVSGAGLLLAAREDHDSGAGADLLPGLTAGLVAGLTYALYAFAIGRLIQPCPSRPHGMEHRTVVAAIQGLAALPMLTLLGFTGESTFAAPVWPILLYLAVIPTALGHTLFAFGLGRMKASTATLYTVLEPVVATVLAVLVLGETFRPEGWTGFPLVVAGLILVNVRPKSRRKAESGREVTRARG